MLCDALGECATAGLEQNQRWGPQVRGLRHRSIALGAGASRSKNQSELFCLLFSAFVSDGLVSPNIWGFSGQERHDSGGSGPVQDAENEQPVDKMWVSCARLQRSPRRFRAAYRSDEIPRYKCGFGRLVAERANTICGVLSKPALHAYPAATQPFGGVPQKYWPCGISELRKAAFGWLILRSCQRRSARSNHAERIDLSDQASRHAHTVKRADAAIWPQPGATMPPMVWKGAHGGSRVVEHPHCRR